MDITVGTVICTDFNIKIFTHQDSHNLFYLESCLRDNIDKNQEKRNNFIHDLKVSFKHTSVLTWKPRFPRFLEWSRNMVTIEQLRVKIRTH